MVDVALPNPKSDGRLRYVFLDLNAYFASVEQQESPELRGKPVAVIPLEADTTFVIAASYEAKACGVKTGTMVRDAKIACPDIRLVQARPPVYVSYHRRVLEAVETVLPIDEVCSIDEMRFRLIGEERAPERAVALAHRLKRAIREHVGDQMRCSVGVAPNAFLSKVATELEKPDGLVVIQSHDLPDRLHSLKLTDFPGINKRMQVRLNAAGIFSSQQMCAASKQEMVLAFGGIVGERWYYMLRGEDVVRETSPRKTLGHSHVLPPELRNERGCREVLLRLIQKASARLRTEKLWAGSMSLYVHGFKKSWESRVRLSPTQDTVRLNEVFHEEWAKRDFEGARSVGVTFSELFRPEQVTPSLFDETPDRVEFNAAIDAMNQKFGKHTVYLAGMERARSSADEKIAFNKTWLFSEGKGDHEWIDTFRGLASSEE
jgi:DNA polymerase-4